MGFVPLPKSVTPSRIQENLRVFDFELSDEDVKLIAGQREREAIPALILFL